MENRAFDGSFEEPGANSEKENARRLLEGHWFTNGDLDVEGVSDEVKAEFIAEKTRENEAAMAKLRDQRAKLDALRVSYPAAEEGFTSEEEEWFAGGDAAARKLALQEYWEEHASLDIEEIPAAEKVAFADDRLRQLKYLAGTEKFRLSEGLRDRIQRLELLRDQYAKEAEQENR